MARRRKGRDVTGWLILDKPAGVSSAKAVAAAQRARDARKAGHAGTLDPAATGLLAIAFGEATKAIPVLADAAKTYRFAVAWGAATDTDDAEGAVIDRRDARPTEAAVRAALPRFTGDILQTPPAVSAVKVDGRRAYALAREGAPPALAPRPLHVARLTLLRHGAETAEFEMVCGKGGYVRAIARDLGAALGCLGHAAWLRRTATGPFDLSGAQSWAEAMEGASPLLPLSAALAGLPAAEVTADGAADLRMGRSIAAPGAPDGRVWARCGADAVALCRAVDGALRPDRVFAPTPTPTADLDSRRACVDPEGDSPID